MSFIAETKYLPSDIGFKRSGIVFYFKEDNELNFIFALDAAHGEMTDMGGTIEYSENFVETGIREAYEESLGIFNFLDHQDYIKNNTISVYNNKMIIMFQYITVNKEKLISFFKLKHLECMYNNQPYENSSLFWISESNLRKLLEINTPNKICKSISIYRESNIPLPKYISESLSSLYNYNILHYPIIYDKIKKLLNPVFDKLMKKIKK